MPQLREFCQAGAVLEKGQLTYYEDIEEAIRVHERNMALV
jgi:capsular polysaccharide transport system ATP-binding protein